MKLATTVGVHPTNIEVWHSYLQVASVNNKVKNMHQHIHPHIMIILL